MILALAAGFIAAAAEPELALERGYAAFDRGDDVLALHLAAEAMDAGADWHALDLMLLAGETAGMSPQVDAVIEERVSLGDRDAAVVWTAHEVANGRGDPGDLAAFFPDSTGLSDLMLGRLALTHGEPGMAVQFAKHVPGLNGDAEDLRIRSSLALHDARHAITAAEAQYQRDPRSPQAVAGLWDGARASSKVKRARSLLLQTAISDALATDDVVRLYRARRLSKAADDSSQVPALEARLVALGESFPESRSHLDAALALERKGDLDGAIDALATDTDIASLTALGRLLLAAKRYQDAEDVADQLLDALCGPVEGDRSRRDNGALARDLAEVFAFNAETKLGQDNPGQALDSYAMAAALVPDGGWEAQRVALIPRVTDELGDVPPELQLPLAELRKIAKLDTAEFGTAATRARLGAVSWSLVERFAAPPAIWSTVSALLADLPDAWTSRGKRLAMTGQADAAFVAFARAAVAGKPPVDELYASWTLPSSPERAIAALVEAESAPQADVPARGAVELHEVVPNFSLETEQRTVKDTELRGQVVVVAFWASWCGPCREELPTLASLSARWHNEGLPVSVLAVSADDARSPYSEFIAERKLEPLEFAWSPALAALFRVDAIPMMWVVGPDGVVESRTLGYAADGGANLDREVRELLP